MTLRRGLTALAVVAGIAAGVLYYVGAQRTPVVVAAVDLPSGRAIAAADLDTRQLPPDALPAGAFAEPARVIGSFPRALIARGQLVLAEVIAPAAAAFDGGIVLPTGYHAIAIPVDPGQALGGAIVPGSRVDVIAVPVSGRAPASRPTELLVPAALVVDVRGEQGGPFERRSPSRQQATAIRERLGSVVIAIGPSQEIAVADRIPTSTFVLVLVSDRR